MTTMAKASRPKAVWGEVVAWATFIGRGRRVNPQDAPDVSRLAKLLADYLKSKHRLCIGLKNIYQLTDNLPIPELPPYETTDHWWYRLLEEYESQSFPPLFDKTLRADTIKEIGLAIKSLKRYENPYDRQKQPHLFLLIEYSRAIASVPKKREDQLRHIRGERLSFNSDWMWHVYTLQEFYRLLKVRRYQNGNLFY